MSHKHWLQIGVLGSLLAICLPTAWGQVNSYNTSASGDWETAGSWSLGVAPGTTQTAIFLTNATTKTVTISSTTPSGNLTISNLTVSAPSGSANTLFINGNSLEIIRSFTNLARGTVTVTNGGFHVKNGTVIEGQVEIQQSASMTSTGLFQISKTSGASGTLTISGGDARINGSGTEMVVGRSGTGRLLMSAGTLVIQNGSSLIVGRSSGDGFGVGTISVSGGVTTNSVTTTVGQHHGNLILSGGEWVQQADITLGVAGGGAAGQGTLSVLGGTYRQTAGAISLGVATSGGAHLGRLIGRASCRERV